jgi:hypothetical protein
MVSLGLKHAHGQMATPTTHQYLLLMEKNVGLHHLALTVANEEILKVLRQRLK